MLQTLFAFWAIWWFKKIFSRKKRRIEKFKKWKWKLLFYEQWLFAIIIIHNGKKLNSGNSIGFINWCVKKKNTDDNLALKVFYFHIFYSGFDWKWTNAMYKTMYKHPHTYTLIQIQTQSMIQSTCKGLVLFSNF